MRRPYYARINNKVKNIGIIDNEEKIFEKTLQKSKHLFKKINAWGIDYITLQNMPDEMSIHIIETEDKKIYKTTAKKWRELGTVLTFKEHGTQTFMPIIKFNIYTYGEKRNKH